MGRLIDLTGTRFGRLMVIERTGNARDGHARWRCLCDCGKRVTVCGNDLKKSTTRSCGCLRLDKVEEMVRINVENGHGKSRSRLYSIWSNMKQRCYNEKHPEYSIYGGRGIKICNEWLRDFMSFYDWALLHGYKEDLSIDRVDVNGPYAPGNCRWATAKEQSNNLRTNRRYTIDGTTKTLKQWSEEYHISYCKLRSRIYIGWSIEEALGLAPRKR